MQTPVSPKPQDLHLTPELLIAAYCQGLFPMARSRYDPSVEWFSPDPRAVLPLDAFRCPRGARQAIGRGTFEVRCDGAFQRVIRACAAPRPRQPHTWINEPIIRAYTELHHRRYAHCVEAWRDGMLAGGLYGVAMGGAFFGESMFHRPELGGTEASKVCLAWLVEHLVRRGFTLLDVQINSEHMMQFGAIDIPKVQYMAELLAALRRKVRW